MNKSAIVAAILAVTTTAAYADPHKVLVLQSEGKADGAVRTKIDGAVLKLAKGLPAADVSPGDTTLSDAAAAVGCKPDAQACRDEIMGMLGVDELVYTSLTPKPGGTEVEVHRAIKGGSTTDAKQVVSGAQADKLDNIAVLFGGVKAGDAFVPPGTKPDTTAKPDATAKPDPAQPPDTTAAPDAGTTDPKPAEPVTTAEATPPVVDAQPNPNPAGPQDTAPGRGRQRLELAGMIGGGALVLIGFMCWGSAADIQSQIDEAPTQTKPQLDNLADLEARGDSYAAWGNVLFLGGAILGGVSTYFFIKDRRARRHATSARITPTVFDHGAGLALTFGAP
jgi:hypothetical protein